MSKFIKITITILTFSNALKGKVIVCPITSQIINQVVFCVSCFPFPTFFPGNLLVLE